MLTSRLALLISGVAIVAVLIWVVLPSPWGVGVLQSRPVLGSGNWTQRDVQLLGSPPSRTSPTCWFVNSTAYTDRFCLTLSAAPAGYILNGTFDHGLFSQSYQVYLSEGPPCFSSCPTSESWMSPDGSGRIWWGFTTNATLYALD